LNPEETAQLAQSAEADPSGDEPGMSFAAFLEGVPPGQRIQLKDPAFAKKWGGGSTHGSTPRPYLSLIFPVLPESPWVTSDPGDS